MVGARDDAGEVTIRKWWVRWTAVALIGLTAASSISCDGAPILGPDISSCLRPIFPKSEGEQHCCIAAPAPGRPIKDFELPTNLPMRVRRPVHRLDDEFVHKYERAVSLMQALPEDDPRSWHRQSQLHCAYAGSAHYQATDQEIRPGERMRLGVHFTWFFQPFHRWFIYFQERIMASLVGDDTFAIPYWAWDVQNTTTAASSGGPAGANNNAIPGKFTDPNSPLYDPRRCRAHAPPEPVLLEIDGCPNVKDKDYIRRSNYYNMWRVMIGDARTTETFHGGREAVGDSIFEIAAGALEMGPHAAVHSWLGDDGCPHLEDMGALSASATDPLFGAHHSQVDRLWEVWKRFGGTDHDDPDFLHSQFLFYDEKGDLVRVNVSQALDLEKLRISYEDVPLDWADELSNPLSSIRERGDPRYVPLRPWETRAIGSEWKRTQFIRSKTEVDIETETEGTTEKVVLGAGRAVLTARVNRPAVRSGFRLGRVNSTLLSQKRFAAISFGTGGRDYDEVLVIKGVVTKPFNSSVRFKIFSELPEADETTPLDCLESMGQVQLGIGGLRSRVDSALVRQHFTYKVGMGKRVAALGITNEISQLAFTFVPAWDLRHDPQVKIELTDLTMEVQGT